MVEEEFEVCANCGQVDCRARDLLPPEKQPFEPCDSWIPKRTN